MATQRGSFTLQQKGHLHFPAMIWNVPMIKNALVVKPKENESYLQNVYIIHRCTVNLLYINQQTTLNLGRYRFMR